MLTPTGAETEKTLVPVPPPGSPPARGLSSDVRMIWTAGGFISPNAKDSFYTDTARFERPQSGMLPTLGGARSGTSSIGKGDLTSGLYSPGSVREFTSVGPPKRAMTARGGRSEAYSPQSEDKRSRLLERRNQKLEAELRQALNLYGQAVSWLEQEREKHKEMVRRHEQLQQREAEVLFEKEREWQDERQRVVELCNERVDKERKHIRALEAEILRHESSELSAEKLAQAQLQAERNRRKEEMCLKMAKRMTLQGLVRGFTSWHASWTDIRRQLHTLQQAANRMRTPALAGAFKQWHLDWRQVEWEKQASAQDLAVVALEQRCAALKEELLKMEERHEQAGAV